MNDILEAMDAIEGFVEGITFDAFKHDDLISSAVIQKFEIIEKQPKISREALSSDTLLYLGERWQE